MSNHVFMKKVVVDDGNLCYNSENKTVLVELVDEEGNCSQGFVPAACVNIEIDSARLIPEPENGPNSAVDSSTIPEKIDCDNLSNSENSPPNTSTRFNWSTGQRKKLLSLYNEYLPKVGPMKKFKNKKNMFEKIANILNEEFHTNLDWNQCCNRQKAVSRQHRSDVKTNRTSGATRKDLEFEEEMEAMKAADDSFEPEVRMGVGKTEHVQKKAKTDEKVPEKPQTNTATTREASGSPASRKALSVQDTLLLISERKEKKGDGRHKEKLELLRAILASKTNN